MVLFLRLDQALELVDAAKDLKETLVIRYMVFNGLSPMEICGIRIEHLDPVECTLFLPRRHWKRDQVCGVDAETVRLSIICAGARKKGPLLRSNRGGHYSRTGIYYLVKRVAMRTATPGREKICPRILKRTFAREWLKATRNVCTLQKQFCHRKLESTAQYLRFALDDVRRNHNRLMRRVRLGQKVERPRLVS